MQLWPRKGDAPSSSTPVHIKCLETYDYFGAQLRILLSSKDTGGQLSLIERIMAPCSGSSLHVHANEDECLHLLEGELEVMIGDETFTVAAGESCFAPRNIPHRLCNRRDTPARAIAVMTPGGFDRYISQAGSPVVNGIAPLVSAPPTTEQVVTLLKLAEEFGIKFLTPPDPPRG